MDFDTAIRAHSAWKMKLAAYISHPDRSLKPDEVGRDDACPLGQWIRTESTGALAKEPQFASLRTQHTAFHRAAADVIRRADAGKDESQEVALGSKSTYGSASSSVVAAIMDMKRHAAA